VGVSGAWEGAGRGGADKGHSRVDVRGLRPVSLGARGEEAKALGPVVCRACSADGERDALFPQGLEHG
jgi:hypothetical protein